MAWPLLTLLLLGSGLFHSIGAADEENLPSAQVVGTVLCAPCFSRGFSRTRHLISGASVLLECRDLGFRKEVTTDESGKFEVHLPPSTSEDAEKTQGCTVKLIESNNPGCDVVSSRSSLRLMLNTQQPQVLSAGVLAFTPREQPSSCARKLMQRGAIGSSSKKVSRNSESARRASETSDHPPPAVTPWWSISEPAPAPVTLPPVLGSTTLPPLPPLFFPPTPGLNPRRPPWIKFPFPPLPQPPIPSPPTSLPPWFRLPLPPLPPVQPRLPLPLLPPFRFPPTPAATPPQRPYFPLPPFPQPPIPSPSTSLPPWFRLPLPPLPPVQPRLPLPLLPPFRFPPTPAATPPQRPYFPLPPLPRPPIPSLPFPLPTLPPHPPTLPFPLPPLAVPGFTPPPPTPRP